MRKCTGRCTEKLAAIVNSMVEGDVHDIGKSIVSTMLLTIQTAFLSSARSIYSMSIEGNLPAFLSKLNLHGHPMNAMIADALFNMCPILLGTSTAILAASAIGYVLANGVSLYTYFKVRNDLNSQS